MQTNCSNIKECIEYCDTRKKLVIKDKGNPQEYRLENNSQKFFCLVKVDGCLDNSQTTHKCDFLLLQCEDKKAYFVELKGAKLDDAMKQIKDSIEKLKNNLNGFSYNARIVLSKQRTPDVKSSDLIKFEKYIRQLGGDVKRGNIVLNETI